MRCNERPVHEIPPSITTVPTKSKKQKSDGQKTVTLCWRYLSSQAVANQVLWTEMSLTTVFGMGTGGPSS